MYLNKSAERAEEIISVPRIIEMSCRITQRRQTGMHSSNLQRCHWKLFFFAFSFANCKVDNENRLCEDQRQLLLPLFREGNQIRAGLLDGRRKMTIYVANKTLRRCCVLAKWFPDPPQKSRCPFCFGPCMMLPLLRALPSCLSVCLWGHLLVQSSFLEEPSYPVRQLLASLSALKSPGGPLFKSECCTWVLFAGHYALWLNRVQSGARETLEATLFKIKNTA